MDEIRRRRDDDVIDKIFDKLNSINENQIRQEGRIGNMEKALFKNNGETCIITKIDDLNESVQELKGNRMVFVSTAQAIWTIIFGFLSIAGTVSAIMLTLKQLKG